MNIQSFLKLAEIQTKVASMIPFFIGTVYAVYRYGRFNFLNFLFMFISLLAFDMATTVVNNFFDYKKAQKKHGYNYESHNAIVRYGLKESSVIAVILGLIVAAVVFGFLLYVNTSPVVLLLGAISFMIGILYSFGPVPISRMPLGEIFSGFFMGFIIIFISVYIHAFDQTIIHIGYVEGLLSMEIFLLEILIIFMVSLPAIVGIANIMLANNICDMEDDLENRRYTLPIYIGKKKALQLFRVLYYIAYLDILVLLIFSWMPIVAALVLLTFLPVSRNIRIFDKQQSKEVTFITAVKNFVVLNGSLGILIAIGILFR